MASPPNNTPFVSLCPPSSLFMRRRWIFFELKPFLSNGLHWLNAVTYCLYASCIQGQVILTHAFCIEMLKILDVPLCLIAKKKGKNCQIRIKLVFPPSHLLFKWYSEANKINVFSSHISCIYLLLCLWQADFMKTVFSKCLCCVWKSHHFEQNSISRFLKSQQWGRHTNVVLLFCLSATWQN